MIFACAFKAMSMSVPTFSRMRVRTPRRIEPSGPVRPCVDVSYRCDVNRYGAAKRS